MSDEPTSTDGGSLVVGGAGPDGAWPAALDLNVVNLDAVDLGAVDLNAAGLDAAGLDAAGLDAAGPNPADFVAAGLDAVDPKVVNVADADPDLVDLADADQVYISNLLDGSEEVIQLKDVQGRFLRVSLGFARLHGREQQEMVGLTDADLLGQTTARRTRREELRVIHTGVPIIHPPRRERSPDRRERWVSSSTFPLRGPGGTIGTIGVSRDVTDLVRAEQEMARLADAMEAANAELRRVETQLRAVLDASTDAIAQYDRRLRYRYVNPAAEQSRGMALTELLGRTDRETGMAEPALQLWEGALRQVLATGEPGELEFSAPAADGTEAWFHTTLSPDRDASGRLTGVLSSTRDITATKQAELALAHQAMHDSVTGLANRYLLIDRLGQALARIRRSTGRLALFFVDLDHFKEVNDTYGHDAGDAVLVEVARRLVTAARAEDTVARLGGDEFVIVCERVADDRDVHTIADRLVQALARPIDHGPHRLAVSASVGAVIATDPDTTPSELLRSADAAMYRAKEGGRNGFRVFGDGADQHADGTALEVDVRGALDRSELRLLYQPLLSLASRRVLGFEAHLRWEHPTRGTLLPQDFLPLAERRGAVTAIGQWALDTACAQLAAWTSPGDVEGLTMAVHVSPRQLQTAGFCAAVAGTLQRHGVDPGRLRLEIHERALLAQDPQVADVLRSLADLGVQLAVDDFGSSLASLAGLPHLPLGVVRLDRFADLPGGGDVLAAVVSAAHGLGMRVVGGGVEDTAQLRQLEAATWGDGDGFLLGRPLSVPEVERLLAADVASGRADGIARDLAAR